MNIDQFFEKIEENRKEDIERGIKDCPSRETHSYHTWYSNGKQFFCHGNLAGSINLDEED